MGKSGKPSVVLMVSGEPGVDRDIPNEEKYQGLATAFVQQGFDLHPVVYHDSRADGLREDLQEFDAILVWVNPLEKGRDRSMLDPLLLELAKKGSYVSAHPDVILKMGTKEVLYKTRGIGWSGDVNLYRTFEDFRTGFPESMGRTGTRVLKQNRGNGGNGVFKVTQQRSTGMFSVAHALGNEVRVHSARSFYDEFAPYFGKGGMLIDQE